MGATKIIYQFTGILVVSLSTFAFADKEGMPSMPIIQAKRIFIVQGHEDLESQMGFGDQEPMVRMMNLMMVEGSGMEGMDMNTVDMNKSHGAMAEMKHGHESPKQASSPNHQKDNEDFIYELKASPKVASVGANILEISIQDKETKKPAKNLKIKAQVYMTSMDMGTEEPKVKEISAGTYQTKAIFSMQGPWVMKLIFSGGKEKIFDFNVIKTSH